jgi:hypothetical protein
MEQATIKRILVLLGIVMLSLGVRLLLLQGASPVSLKYDPVADATYKSLRGPGAYTFLEQKDFTITQEKYFQDKKWVVVSLKPIGESADPATVILEDINGNYQKVAGPSNFFQDSDLASLPTEVVNFIKSGSSK